MKLGFNTSTSSNRGISASSLFQQNLILEIQTPCRGFTEITEQVNHWIDSLKIDNGLLTAFICHTSASLLIQENADITVQYDLLDQLDVLGPVASHYRHSNEGADDMPAHIKSMLTQTSLTIPVQDGKTVLGTWQGIFVIEHRSQAHTRKVALHFLGEQTLDQDS